MSSLLARIMLAIFMLPAAAVAYVIVLMTVHELRVDPTFGFYPRRVEWIAAGVASWVMIAAWWMLLWRKSVAWTKDRKQHTLWAAGGAVLAGAVAGLLTRPIDKEFGDFVFTAVTPLVWLPLTVLIWRESKDERASRLAGVTLGAIVCPTCGYNLTGLTTARCPECGSTFTLDDLLAQQPGVADAGAEFEKS